jgi:small conductance mechanosensitive channel
LEYPGEPSYFKMRSKAIKAIKKAFDEQDITIPFPIRTLDFGIKGLKTLPNGIKDKWSNERNTLRSMFMKILYTKVIYKILLIVN